MNEILELRTATILLSGPYDRMFDYLIPNSFVIKIGSFVIVPFGKQEIIGIVISKDNYSVPISKLKKIKSHIKLKPLPAEYITFINFFSNWNCTIKGNILKLMLSPHDKNSLRKDLKLTYKIKNKCLLENIQMHELLKLNSYQKYCSKKMIESLNRHKPSYFLLDGVAGSGKTETYLEVVKKCLENKKQVLILLPEIGLTAEWESRFLKKFGFYPKIWHSNISKSQKKKIWLAAYNNECFVLVGARSALFVPLNNLGLIIIDEEHDISYKQDEGIRYHGRDMSIYLASVKKIPIILASATPSIESINNVNQKKFVHLNLPSRATGAKLPEIKLIDLKKNKIKKSTWLSDQLLKELDIRLKKNEQSLIFLNRRGYSRLSICRNCGAKVNCKNCNSWLVEHKSYGTYLCHYCGFKKKIEKVCTNCNSTEIVNCGPGVEKINEEILKYFPEARVEILSSDTTKNLENFKLTLNKIEKGEVDLIIGTQLLSKGYDFPKLTFVAIIDADTDVYGSDLRSNEKFFQLLMQVSGRAGRHLKSDRGLVYIQTHNPENEVLKSIQEMNKSSFFKKELNSRKISFMPPFSKIISIIISSKSQDLLHKFSIELLEKKPKYDNVEVFGPAPAPLNFLRGRYRNRFLVKSNKSIKLQNIVIEWMSLVKAPKRIRVSIDVEPYNFM